MTPDAVGPKRRTESERSSCKAAGQRALDLEGVHDILDRTGRPRRLHGLPGQHTGEDEEHEHGHRQGREDLASDAQPAEHCVS